MHTFLCRSCHTLISDVQALKEFVIRKFKTNYGMMRTRVQIGCMVKEISKRSNIKMQITGCYLKRICLWSFPIVGDSLYVYDIRGNLKSSEIIISFKRREEKKHRSVESGTEYGTSTVLVGHVRGFGFLPAISTEILSKRTSKSNRVLRNIKIKLVMISCVRCSS